MKRLTIPDEKTEGGWKRAVIDPGEVKKYAMTLYWTLKKYEDTGLTPDEINALRERDTAKEPEEIRDAFGDGRLICPNCRNSVINYFNRSRPPRFHYRLDIQQDIKQGKFAWQKESRRSSASTWMTDGYRWRSGCRKTRRWSRSHVRQKQEGNP